MNIRNLSIKSFFAGAKQYIKENPLLIILFLFYFAVEISIWIMTHGFPGMKDYAESYSFYVAGKNFAKYGIWNLKFLTDYATGSSPEAHPYHYTQMGHFVAYVEYFLIKIGIHSMPVHSFIMIFILGLGLFFMYLTIKEFTHKKYLALLALFLSVIYYQSVLIAGFDVFRAWSFLTIFAPIYFLKKYDSEGKNKYLWFNIFFYFLLVNYDFIYTTYVFFLIFFLKLFNLYKNISYKKIFLTSFIGIILPFLLHKLLVIIAIGPRLFLTDFWFYLSNKLTGNPPVDILQDFYNRNGIVFWGASVRVPLSYIFDRLYFVSRHLFGNLLILSLILLFIINLIQFGIRKFPISDKLPAFLKVDKEGSRLFLAFTISLIIPTVIFRANMDQVYLNPAVGAPFFVFPVVIGGGLLFYSLIKHLISLIKAKKLIKTFMLSICTILVFSSIFATTYRYLIVFTPIHSLPAYNVLSKYKNHSFATNGSAFYINYFTDEWANNSWGIDSKYPDFTIREFQVYLFEKDKLVNSKKYRNPEYLFIMYFPSDPSTWRFKNSEKIFKQYPLVEKGENFWIFDMRLKSPRIRRYLYR